jgi:hypothetical protein
MAKRSIWTLRVHMNMDIYGRICAIFMLLFARLCCKLVRPDREVFALQTPGAS